MRLWALVLLLISPAGLAGCGIWYSPVVERFPDPVRAVRVVDDQTGNTIAGAQSDLRGAPP